MASPRSCTAMATWSISVSRPEGGSPLTSCLATKLIASCSVPPEESDLVFAHLLAELGVVDAEALLGGQAQDTDLALVQVVVDLVGGLARLGEGVDGRQDGLDGPVGDQPVGLPRLLVVGEVGGDDPLQLHPEVAVVV